MEPTRAPAHVEIVNESFRVANMARACLSCFQELRLELTDQISWDEGEIPEGQPPTDGSVSAASPLPMVESPARGKKARNKRRTSSGKSALMTPGEIQAEQLSHCKQIHGAHTHM